MFGCLCFSFARTKTSNKFQSKTYPCVFIGYSSQQKGYGCLHPSTGKVYISRHVVFDDQNFPLLTL